MSLRTIRNTFIKVQQHTKKKLLYCHLNRRHISLTRRPRRVFISNTNTRRLALHIHRQWCFSTDNNNNTNTPAGSVVLPPNDTSILGHSIDSTTSGSTSSARITGTSNAVLSTFDMFTIGIGPSSSHTVGPMRAAKKFIDRIPAKQLDQVAAVKVELYGSLACTGLGHGTDFAILMGLEGETPEEINPTYAYQRSKQISRSKKLKLHNKYEIKFAPLQHLVWFMDQVLPYHSNGMRLIAYSNESMQDDSIIYQDEYYSVGGGFVTNSSDINTHNVFRYIDDSEYQMTHEDPSNKEELDKYKNEMDDCPPMLFGNGKDLFRLARAHQLKVSEVVLENELYWRSKEEIEAQLMRIWTVMSNSIETGIKTRGILPGEIQATRRAPILYKKLTQTVPRTTRDSASSDDGSTGGAEDVVASVNSSIGNGYQNDALNSIIGPHYQDWLYCWAMAVNEENAAGGKVVTAPTNGAAGVIPAVIKYYTEYHKNPTDQGIQAMLMTAAAIGMLYKRGASLSAAEVGCQGEVGVAASMAAGALCEVMGGTLAQVEAAAEIAMEHSLGLTCDPIGGYVQIPCIERNAIGSAKAVASARMALMGDGKQIVSLDAVIETMRQTGEDMSHKYKETALAGLAVNVPIC